MAALIVIPNASAWTIIQQPEVSNITQEALDAYLDNDITDERLLRVGVQDIE